MRRRIILLLLIFLLTLSTQKTLCNAAGVIKKHTNVRLKENSWIKILDQKEEIESVDAPHLAWMIYVKILFKKYCKASVKKSKFEELINDPNATPEEIAKAFGESVTKIEDRIPKFKCDYRTTVCLTLYSSDGKELETMRRYAWGKVGPDGNWVPDAELLPGDTIWVIFARPYSPTDPSFEKPANWQVWVPK